MKSTFIVTLEIADVNDIPNIAIDIEDDLMQSGHDVIEVKPWTRPTLGMEPTDGGAVFGAGANQPPPSLF